MDSWIKLPGWRTAVKSISYSVNAGGDGGTGGPSGGLGGEGGSGGGTGGCGNGGPSGGDDTAGNRPYEAARSYGAAAFTTSTSGLKIVP